MSRPIPFLVAIIIIVICAVLAGGIIFWQYFGVPKGGKITNWATYRNEEHGFEVGYPKSWYAYEAEGLTVISTFSPKKYEKYYYIEVDYKILKEDNYGLIHMTYLKEKSLEEMFAIMKFDVENRITTGLFESEKFVTEEVNIKGMKGYRIYYRGREVTTDEEGIYIIFLFLDKNTEGYFRFEGKFAGKDKKIYEKYANQFKQMLSTFRFLE